jgi:diacylglycerol kinase (ATP)
MRRGLLIYNSAAGSGRHAARLQNILRILQAGGVATEAVATQQAGHATTFARRAADARSVDVVFAYGGDGTVREVAAGLLGSPVALGVIPGGTTNVVAVAFGLPAKAELAAERLCHLEPRPMDVGLFGGRPFLMQASSGLEAVMMARSSGSRLKVWFGVPGVFAATVPAILGYGFPEIEAEVDGRVIRATGVCVCNIPELAGPYRVVPSGRFDDRQMEVVLFRGKGLWSAISFSLDLYRGRHTRRADVEILPASVVRFLGPRGIIFQIDGDAIADGLPVEVRLAADRLMVLAERGERAPP